MTELWIAIALVTAGVALALARPLMKPRESSAVRAEFDMQVFRDQLRELERDVERGLLDADAAEAARVEIQRRLLTADAERQAAQKADAGSQGAGKLTFGAVVAGPPLAALAFYLTFGSPGAPDVPYAERNLPQRPQVAQAEPHTQAAETEALIGQLAERLLQTPDDVRGWVLLGRTYMSVDKFPSALNAFKRARTLAPDRLDIDVAYAEALILTNDHTVTPEAHEIFTKVTRTEPLEPKSRFYLGMHQAQSGDVRGALQTWIDLLTISPNDAPWVPIVMQQAQRAVQELGIEPASVKPTAEALKLADSLRLADSVANLDTAGTGAAASPSDASPSSASPGPTAADVQAAQQLSEEDRAAFVQAMVQRLANRLENEPDDLDGWQRLLRAYQILGETDKAREVEAKLKALQGQ